MIDEIGAENRGEMAFRDRHAHGIGESLAKRASGGLDPGRVAVLGMPGRNRAELTKAFDLLDRHGLVAEEIKECVKQHRSVAGGKQEAIAVGPGRIGRVELQKLGEQDGGDIGRTHRQAGMAGFGLFHRIHGQCANSVGHAVVLRA